MNAPAAPLVLDADALRAARTLARFPIVSDQGWYGVLTLRIDPAVEQLGYHVQGALSILLQRELRSRRHAEERERELRLHLAQAERARTIGELVHGLAHEINTPLGVAITASSSLDEQGRHLAKQLATGKLAKSELSAFFDFTQRSMGITAGNLGRIAELVRTLKKSAISVYGVDAQALRVDELIRSILSLHQAEMDLRFIAVHASLSPIEILGVQPVLIEVISALIRNVLDHAFMPPLLREPHLHIELERHAAGMLQLVVEDNGTGVPSAMQDRLFQPFASAGRALGHRGLGLSIVSSLVTDGLAGTIHHETRHGGGARFVLRFPALPAGEGGASPPGAID